VDANLAPDADLKLDPVKATETGSSPRLRVAPPAPISAPRAPFVSVVISLVVAGVLGILVINTKTNENSFRITKLQDQQAALNAQQQDLENRIAEYSTPNYLNAAARRLGLVKADNLALIRLPDGKVIGVPRPGEGQPAVTSQDGANPAPTATADDNALQNGTVPSPVVATNAVPNAEVPNTTVPNTTVPDTTAQNNTVQNNTTNTGQNGSTAQDGAVPNGAGQ
jgi:cell division protein FtsB